MNYGQVKNNNLLSIFLSVRLPVRSVKSKTGPLVLCVAKRGVNTCRVIFACIERGKFLDK